ncbi:MAG: DUF1998 domain-containing protein [Pyrinomonadaceae bacterium]|nr:DUF1998 domain-containing protein [Pyrinomonadaceae bacterium]
MGSQSLRRSQFITTYGPGAILEGSNGPRIIPTIDRSNIFSAGSNPVNFEITDRRLSHALLDDAGILRIPSNAELGVTDSQSIYDTSRFPTWSLCVRHGILYRKVTSSPANQACPRCNNFNSRPEAWIRAGKESIRFVRACQNGHIDDVDWNGIINHTRQHTAPNHFLWQGGGGALRHVNIVCPTCNGSINLGLAYSRSWRCSGRFAESGVTRPGCSVSANIIQRGAANLRLAEIQTALTIPPRATRLHRLLEMDRIHTSLVASEPSNKAALIELLQRLRDRGLITQAVIDEIHGFDEPTILNAIGDVLSGGLPQNVNDLRDQEFEALKHSAEYGAPPQPSSTPGAPPQFQVVRTNVRSITTVNGRSLRITPIERLRVVMVQTGYRRIDPVNAQFVDRRFTIDHRDWYPGIELFGEGIFIDFVQGNVFTNFTGAASTWFDEWHQNSSFSPVFLGEQREHLHPEFVWWHTFSHKLITALSVDSGYSSAAVRERVYTSIDPITGQATGGVLLYTAQPGGDGTLGGLIALVPSFERVIDLALGSIHICSNDPLCSEEVFQTGKYSGAACYACSLISETSCEFRNMRLDRNILRENLP